MALQDVLAIAARFGCSQSSGLIVCRTLIRALKILGWVSLAAVVILFLVAFWVWILIGIILLTAAQS